MYNLWKRDFSLVFFGKDNREAAFNMGGSFIDSKIKKKIDQKAKLVTKRKFKKTSRIKTWN